MARSFASLSQAEEENGQSRIYLGIHWAFDKTEGISQGRRVADYVFRNAFVPVQPGPNPTATSTSTPIRTPTSTPIRTPMSTPTATATTSANACATNVGVGVAADGTGRLQVTITANTSAATPTNQLTALRFGTATNALIDAGRQLVMTSDRAPEDIPGLEARLIERFRSGLVAEVDTPEVEVRMAILAKRARLDKVDVGSDVLAEIASRVTTSVRALEGALIRVVAYASMHDEPPTPELARHVLRRLGADEAPGVRSVSEILDATAQEFGLDPTDLKSKSRRQPVARARQVAMYLARDLTEHTPDQIGMAFDRDRTTVNHAIKQIDAAVKTDGLVRNSVNNLRRRLAHPSS
jgi:hypothetical protein